MKVYLDDEREAPEGWDRVKTPSQAIELLKSGGIDEISLDHDLGDDEKIGTGYDVLVWIERQVIVHGYIPPVIHIHTANPSARIKMELALESINKRIH